MKNGDPLDIKWAPDTQKTTKTDHSPTDLTHTACARLLARFDDDDDDEDDDDIVF